MTVDECIRAYKDVAQQVFTPKVMKFLPASPAGAFSAQKLEAAVKQTVRGFCTEAECVTRRQQDPPTLETCQHGEAAFRSESCTKTYVPAVTIMDALETIDMLQRRISHYEG